MFMAITIFLINQAYDTALDSSLKKMVPLSHPFIQNLYKHKDELSLGNDIRIAVEHTQGDIFDKEYLEVLRQVSDEAFYLPGVNKSLMKSLWSPTVRWSEVDMYGFRGGEVIPPNYDGSDAAIEEVQKNVLRSDQVGILVSDDMRSSIIHLPLIDVSDASQDNPNKIDYKLLADQIELGIRQRFESDTIKIHVIGFAKKIGDLIEAAKEIVIYFILTVLITFHILVYDNRCARSSAVIIVGAIMAVVWQLGIVSLLHKAVAHMRGSDFWNSLITDYPTIEPIQFGLDPYSMLVPFLVFAIAISHGVQYTNDMARRMAKGEDSTTASKHTFEALFIPGLLALLSDAFGFITLWFIDIGVIRELAITASVGVAVIILTKLIFVPIILSYIGISNLSIKRLLKKQSRVSPIARQVASLTQRRTAVISLITATTIAMAGFIIKQDLKVGDLDAGAPELHPDSRYNLDNAYITGNYSVSADVLVVMVETPPATCTTYPAMTIIDDFMWHMENIEGVDSTASVVTISKHLTGAFNEGSMKWATLSKIPEVLNSTMVYLPQGFINTDCSLVPVFIFLDDHKAVTLDRVVAAAEEFSTNNRNKDTANFILASGNAGIEAATNQTIRVAERRILLMVFAVVALMVFVSFRSWRAVVCVVAPLFLTSILCEALMTVMDIGVKVATLPVIALGVGIGVDYGIYIFAGLQRNLATGLSLQDAYLKTLLTTGRSVMFTCFTLSISVGSWVFSSIKFQADMGILLTFMFLWNMVGAIWLLPALCHFLPINQKHSLTIKTQGANQTP